MKKFIMYLVLIIIALGTCSIKAKASNNVERIFGKDRVEGSVKVSERAYNKTDTVILSLYQEGIDSLSGTILVH